MNSVHKPVVFLVARHLVGGILTFFRYIYGQACFRDYEFVIVSTDPEIESSLAGIFKQSGLVYIPCRSNTEILSATWRYLRNNPVNLVHSHGFSAGALVTPLAKICGIPHLMTTHDVFQESQFTGYSGKLKKILLSQIAKRIDAIHTVGREATANLEHYFPRISEEKIYCIENGIDTDEFYYANKIVDQADKDLRDEYIIGFFGRFMSQKGFKYLVDALEIIIRDKMCEKNPVVYTFGWGGFIREEYEALERRNLKQYFRMMPHTDDMPAAIKSVDLVVMPSLWEAYPLLAMESLVAGVPIIGTDCIGLNEVLTGSPAVMVEPRNSTALAGAIAGEINNSRTEEFGKYSLIAKERFSLERPSRELKKLYDKLVS